MWEGPSGTSSKFQAPNLSMPLARALFPMSKMASTVQKAVVGTGEQVTFFTAASIEWQELHCAGAAGGGVTAGEAQRSALPAESLTCANTWEELGTFGSLLTPKVMSPVLLGFQPRLP